jgi:hypothetical protein
LSRGFAKLTENTAISFPYPILVAHYPEQIRWFADMYMEGNFVLYPEQLILGPERQHEASQGRV